MNLEEISRKRLEKLAKRLGIKSNQSNEELISQIRNIKKKTKIEIDQELNHKTNIKTQNNKIDLWQLKYRQNLPLDLKIRYTENRITSWYNYWQGNVYIAFSGGIDSTVLLHIARQLYPDVPATFINTGLEYPEIVEFVKTIENVTTIRPRLSFKQVLDIYGYPVISKSVARQIKILQNPTPYNQNLNRLYSTGYNQKGEYCSSYKLPIRYRYLVEAPFYISDECCNVMKKQAIHPYVRKTKRKAILGIMASESEIRMKNYLRQGCNLFSANTPISMPISFWTRQDALAYIQKYNIPYSKIYGNIINEYGMLMTSGADRTGCMFCMFGVHLEESPNRFEKMKITHPQLYDYCLNKLNLKRCLDFIKVPY
jgi:3'-phosphoadenosine 5'-phosphosulfate sulfotransferase (PAPS reductase)/FAD synthetase